MNEAARTLSIGLAVRNGKDVVARCIESVLTQDFADFELVIRDNVSDDGTIGMLEDYARSDPRIAFSVNEVNVGSHENMRLVLEASRGRFFRWISADDWLEPGCLSACVEALESRPDAIGVTTWFTIHTADGPTRYEEYRGEFPNSPDPARRFARMLWFFHAGDAKYDPVYGMYRREQPPARSSAAPLGAQRLASECRACPHRPDLPCPQAARKSHTRYPVDIDRTAFRRRLNPVRGEQLRTSPRRLHRELLALAVTADLTDAQLRHCKQALRRFWIKEVASAARSRAADMRARALATLLEADSVALQLVDGPEPPALAGRSLAAIMTAR